jgi:heme/copper-type cytochrome/quinol oxidase subunit 2
VLVSPILADALFWSCVAAVTVAQVALLRSAARVVRPGVRAPDVPVASRRAMELVWAVVPAIVLALAIVWAWKTMHPATAVTP